MNGILHSPVDGTIKITSHYGMRKNPVTGKQSMHNGVDIGGSAVISRAIFAVANGVVIDEGYNSVRGNYITIKHDDWYTLYQHLYTKHVVFCENVKAGEQIGVMGTTGNSTGVHLHFEIWDVYKKPVNPMPYITNFLERKENEMTEKEVISLIELQLKQFDPVFNHISDVPKSLQKETQELIDIGAIAGDGKTQLGSIKESTLRAAIIAKRAMEK